MVLAAAGGGIAGMHTGISGIRGSIIAGNAEAEDWKRADTDWFRDCGWGVFCHYLTGNETTVENWNRQVNSFNTERLADQLESVGARYFFITVGQNSGHYCSPNKAYDAYVGISPSKCSERDLVSDLADSVAKRGIRLITYLPSGAPAADPIARQRLKWKWGYEIDWPGGWGGKRTGDRLVEFQKMWEEIIREWSKRWGKKVSGWWLDGCYFADEMYRHPDPPNFRSFSEALKAGNPESIVAYNGGVFVDMKERDISSLTEFEDYTAGEVARAFPVCAGRWVNGAQYQILSYLGENWGRAPLRFVDEFVIGYTKDVMSKGGVVTWDVPITKDGAIEQEFLTQLRTLSKAIR